MRKGTDQNWYPLPTADELKALANEAWILSDEINTARLDGFLSAALAQRRQQANSSRNGA